MTRIERLRRIVEKHQYEQIERYVVDVQTAQALVLVHDALKPENQAIFNDPKRIPLPRLCDFAWKHVSLKQGGSR